MNKRFLFITGKSTFIITLVIIIATLLSVYFTGIPIHRSIIQNSFISLSILSTCFFLFISVSLFLGIKIKDNVGDLTKQIKVADDDVSSTIIDTLSSSDEKNGCFDFSISDYGESLLFSILTWLLVSVILVLLLALFQTLIWALLLSIIAMLYWVFFRALRFVFKNTHLCKGHLQKSIRYGLSYTVLYTSWIYIILLIARIIK